MPLDAVQYSVSNFQYSLSLAKGLGVKQFGTTGLCTPLNSIISGFEYCHSNTVYNSY